MANTDNKTKKLPKLEASMIPYDERKNIERKGGKKAAPNITIATPKLAPELSPKTYGPANGFRNNVCINNPLIESPIPTNIATIAFGNL